MSFWPMSCAAVGPDGVGCGVGFGVGFGVGGGVGAPVGPTVSPGVGASVKPGSVKPGPVATANGVPVGPVGAVGLRRGA
jgi:hypothetical protein